MAIYLPGGKALLNAGKFVTNADKCCCPCEACPGIVMPLTRSVTITGVEAITSCVPCVGLYKIWTVEPDWSILNSVWTLNKTVNPCVYESEWKDVDATLGVSHVSSCTVIDYTAHVSAAMLSLTVYGVGGYSLAGRFLVASPVSYASWFSATPSDVDICSAGDTVKDTCAYWRIITYLTLTGAIGVGDTVYEYMDYPPTVPGTSVGTVLAHDPIAKSFLIELTTLGEWIDAMAVVKGVPADGNYTDILLHTYYSRPDCQHGKNGVATIT